MSRQEVRHSHVDTDGLEVNTIRRQVKVGAQVLEQSD